MATVVLAGGGTGGHVYPALAMGEALAARGHDLRYYGDPRRLEGRVVPERGLPFTPIPSPQYPRGGAMGKLRFAWQLLGAIRVARRFLKQHEVDLVLGVGGYISAPPVLAAYTLGITRVVHESNVTPGLANKLCARFANLVMLAYSQTGPKLPGVAPRETVGCPVNPKVLEGDAAAAFERYGLDPGQPTLLIVGGSLGAQTLNDLGIAIAKASARSHQLILVTGPAYIEATTAALDPLPPGVCLVDYERKMPEAYAAADLVVCRAGSSTLAELTALGKPSLLIPSPNVTDNHQEGNARGLEEVGAAEVVVEKDIDFGAVAARIEALLADADRLRGMEIAARGEGKLDTAERVADLIEGWLR